MTADLIERKLKYLVNAKGVFMPDEARLLMQQAADELARLRGERDMYRDTLAELCGEMVVCEAERDALRKALEPFAASPRGLEITIEELANARRALTSQKENENG